MSTNNSNQSFRWTRLPRPDRDAAAANGADNATSTVSPIVSNRKRERHDGGDDHGENSDGYHPYPDEDSSDAQFGASYAALGTSRSSSSSAGGPRPTKRRRQTGPDLVAFDKPFPCAFRPCHYRATCTYHHGVPVPCDCGDPACPRGHAHRRRPQECDHGGTHQCRWNMLGECSFHHGIEESCDCDDVECRRAHPRRTKKNKEARKLLKKASKKTEKRKAKREKKAKKGKKKADKSHYRQWRDTQKTDETNQEKRRRYLELYPNGAPTTVSVKEEEEES